MDCALASPPGAAIKVARGRLAQLVERLLYTQDVGGSSPSPPTSLRSLRELRLGQPAQRFSGEASGGCRAAAARQRRRAAIQQQKNGRRGACAPRPPFCPRRVRLELSSDRFFQILG